MKGMTIVYEVNGSLYVNVTNRCTNRCVFCIRKNGDGAYGSDSLWLLREPSEQQITEVIFSKDLQKYTELVFCGYGEPGIRLDVCRNVALAVKSRYPKMPVRINTNGHTSLIYGEESVRLYKDAFDTVSISLNAPNSEKYDEICQPVSNFEHSLPAIIAFAKNVKNYVHNVVFTVVGDFLTEEEIEECRKISAEVGIPLRVRDYIAPKEG